MPDFTGYVRRIDFEPKMDYLGYRTYAHIFLKDQDREVDVYTEDARLEAAVLAGFDPLSPLPPQIRIEYEDIDLAKKLTRVIVDRELNQAAPPRKRPRKVQPRQKSRTPGS